MDSLTEIFQGIREFTAEFQGLDESEIASQSRLEEDLQIWGDDAVEYLIAFGKHFHVDVSRFMAADYFSGEGIDLLALFRKSKQIKKVLRIHDLEKAVAAGRLDEDVIDSE